MSSSTRSTRGKRRKKKPSAPSTPTPTNGSITSSLSAKEILFQILTTGTIRAELAIFFAWMTKQKAAISLFMAHRGYVNQDRNEGIDQWLTKGKEEWLIQCDEDMVPPLNVLDLARNAKNGGFDISGVIYLCSSDRGPMIAAKGLEAPCADCPGEDCSLCGGSGTYTTRVYPAGKEEPAVVPVDWIGTGCWAIHRSAAEKMISEYGRVFDFDWDERGGKASGCDVHMSRRARAIGLKVGVDRSLVAGHGKSSTWAPTPSGQLSMPPWGSYWIGDDVPTSPTNRTSLPDLLNKLLREGNV